MRYLSRRCFLAAGGAAALAVTAGRSRVLAQETGAAQSNRLPITVAGYRYNRVRALADLEIPIEGCDVTFEEDGIGKMNTHAFKGPQTREVTEIGLSPFMLAFCNGGFRDYELLPIPILRMFRHKSIFVRTDRGIKKPTDLRGRKVATVGYSSSGLTWIRGILQQQYGVKPSEIEWIVTGADSSAKITGGASAWEKVLPADLTIQNAPAGKDDSDLLISGEVDAIFHPAEPQAFIDRHPKIDRLFPDHRTVERAYFEETGVFPIMHVVAIRRDAAKANPWLPRAVFDAYCQAKKLDYQEMHKMGSYYSSLPWFGQELRDTRELMGENFYPYGVSGMRKAMETAFRFSYEQGLANRVLKLEEVLHQSSLDFEETLE
jgi:4,5-dihydroxyphthalate decarboxylase